ncbi:hypothetical protein [Roseateles sp.]|uniref:hypothetical protein n=1 Tax=Roseateles sp. TaxID=1971397 RepID=UPI0025F0783E|nr:hypothetical protein [Roseateles sp.]MBV8035877.1 hypothetical protein [Roseateles sp.]
MPTDSSPPPRQPTRRLLSGGGDTRSGGNARRLNTAAADTESFTATEPFDRARPRGAPAPATDSLPRWARGVVIGGVLLAVGMPAAVLLSRSVAVQGMLQEQSTSTADLVCTSGEGRANDSSSVFGWLFGGSHVRCSEWETREARQQRERAQAEANYLARERARQQRY